MPKVFVNRAKRYMRFKSYLEDYSAKYLRYQEGDSIPTSASLGRLFNPSFVIVGKVRLCIALTARVLKIVLQGG